jgi:hypothetical protein
MKSGQFVSVCTQYRLIVTQRKKERTLSATFSEGYLRSAYYLPSRLYVRAAITAVVRRSVRRENPTVVTSSPIHYGRTVKHFSASKKEPRPVAYDSLQLLVTISLKR